MKPPPFEYVEPTDLATAIDALAADEDARALAGGQSLVPMLNFRLARPTTLVGLRKLADLRGIESRNGELRIGAMVTQSEALNNQDVSLSCPLVHDALAHIGHPQIRSRGTVGGTLAHCDPAAELPAVLLALDGAVSVHGPRGSRSVPAEQLFRGIYTTSLVPGEIITDVRFPLAGRGSGTACVELTRRPGDFAVAGAACQLTFAEDGAISDARVALFAVADTPVRARSVEDALKGARPTDQTWAAAARLATDGWEQRAAGTENGRYRIRVAPTIVRRALIAAAGRAR